MPILPSPAEFIRHYPAPHSTTQAIAQHRTDIQRIITQSDPRLLIVVGPCSIDDPRAALDYAHRLATLSETLSDTLKIVMRCYYEKQRTQLGWTGFIHAPHLNASSPPTEGLRLTRELLLSINALGLAVATEYIDPISLTYTQDLIAWSALGARTSESHLHRAMASDLPMPVGFKHNTAGNIQTAIDAMITSAEPQHRFTLTPEGKVAAGHSRGNQDTHIILRGGQHQPNCDPATLAATCQQLQQQAQTPHLMIDCSHGNAQKNHHQQHTLCQDLCDHLPNGVMGLMIESYLVAGNQAATPGSKKTYGQSITDPCLGWEDTALLLTQLAQTRRETHGQ